MKTHMKHEKILLSHGSGGKLSHQLIQSFFLPKLENPYLESLDDGAIFSVKGDAWVMTTDSYVVDPIFFPGGDIGKLAVSGTINDLAVMGAVPGYLSLGMIIEEGFSFDDLEKILTSIQDTCRQAGVMVVTGDTKVVPRGFMDKIFINTSGIGRIPDNFRMSRKIQAGDKILINGTIGDHGTTIMGQREGLKMKSSLTSDCAPLNDLIRLLHPFGQAIRMMRDPTRGGVATTLNEIAEGTDYGLIMWEENLPTKAEVSGLCEILGLDPLYIANEGKVLIIAESSAAEKILSVLKSHPLGEDAQIIGEVVEAYPGKVVMETQFGSRRIIDMLTGEQLPRIC